MSSLALTVDAQDKKMGIGIGFGGAAVNSNPTDGDKANGFGFSFFLNYLYNIDANLSMSELNTIQIWLYWI